MLVCDGKIVMLGSGCMERECCGNVGRLICGIAEGPEIVCDAFIIGRVGAIEEDGVANICTGGCIDLCRRCTVHEDPKLKSLAWGFISGEKPLRKQFEGYYQKWLKDCDFNFTEEFLQQTMELFDAIEVRLDREKTVLLPKVEQSGVFAHA